MEPSLVFLISYNPVYVPNHVSLNRDVLRRPGHRVRVGCHRGPSGSFYTVEWSGGRYQQARETSTLDCLTTRR